MVEVHGDVWDYYDQGYWLVVTTNGSLNRRGECVMGAGIAKQAAQRYPELPKLLGRRLRTFGNIVHLFPALRVITFPVKRQWHEPADPELIYASSLQLRNLEVDGFLDIGGEPTPVAMVRPGCGNGWLDWEEVKHLIEPVLSTDRYLIVDDGSGKATKALHRRRLAERMEAGV